MHHALHSADADTQFCGDLFDALTLPPRCPDAFLDHLGRAGPAESLPLRSRPFEPGANPPAGQVADQVTTAAYEDEVALKAFADNLTYGPFPAIADARLGYESTVVAIKANEAVQEAKRVEIPDELYEL